MNKSRTKVTKLHREAMEATDQGFLLLRSGSHTRAKEAFRIACGLESQAADLVDDDEQPTKSILLRSAATLALRSDSWREAEKLAARALAGDPPDTIAEELRDVLEESNARRHMALKGVKLASAEVQLSVSGPGIGHGFAPSREILQRIENVEKLIERRIQSQHGSDEKVQVNTYLSVPRAASFAVTLRVGSPQLDLFENEDRNQSAILETLDLLEQFNRGAESLSREKFPDESSYRHFVHMAESLLPDGKSVDQVGFTTTTATSTSSSMTREVALRRRRRPIKRQRSSPTPKSKEVSLEGHLHFADSTGERQNQIKLTTPSGPTFPITVPDALVMEDIVRPLWGKYVAVEAKKTGRIWSLMNIAEASRD